MRHLNWLITPWSPISRVADPNRKGSVENAVQHTQGTALAGRRFETLEAQNKF
jgi:hypothetical protein